MAEPTFNLFGDVETSGSGVIDPGVNPLQIYVEVALEQAIDHVLDYAVPKALSGEIAAGQRVTVPLGRGNKLVRGFVTKVKSTTGFDLKKIKPLGQIIDTRQLVSGPLLELALWLSRYYFSPLGVVLDAMVPGGVKKRSGMSRVRYVTPIAKHEDLQAMFEKVKAPRRRALIAHLMQIPPGESMELARLAAQAKVTPTLVRKLAELGLVRIDLRKELVDVVNPSQLVSVVGDVAYPFVAPKLPMLTHEQSRAMQQIEPLLTGRFSVTLIRGVTGSGKTELYLRAIARVLEQGGSAIVMVPEIALTPQTVKRFTTRFGESTVAVMHSGLSGAGRHRQWGQISTGASRIVVGARSAIFAPVKDLGIIVVDEEHEHSYKQDSSPRYQGRDVAIKRAQLQKVPILLGSATPSLEMWHRARTDIKGVYHLIELDQRVANRPMPEVELVDLKSANKLRQGVHLFSPRLEQCLKHVVDRGEQAIILLNRRGYSNFIFCSSCNEPVQCRFCDTTMTFHRDMSIQVPGRTAGQLQHAGQMRCHYCLTTQPLPTMCPTCGKKLSLFGLGTQRVEEEMTRKFPGIKFARVDSDAMKGQVDYETLLGQFARGEIQVLMGTQMLAKGLDFPNVTLVGIINGDTAQSLPDYRASERTFQLLTQVAGRAGRADKPGRVILQTFLPDDPTIRSSLTQDYVAFATEELAHRKQVGLPPFLRQARIVLRDTEPEKLTMRIEKLASEIRQELEKGNWPVQMTNPTPCAIGRIAGYWRQQIVLTSEKVGVIQDVLTRLRLMSKLVSSDRVGVDIDPMSLL